MKNSINSYTIDRTALAAGKAAIEDKEYFEETRNKIIKTRENVSKTLKKMGFKVLDSKANFIFISHKDFEGQYLYEELRNRGVLVRFFNKDRINKFLRVTIGTDEEMDILIEKLREITKVY